MWYFTIFCAELRFYAFINVYGIALTENDDYGIMYSVI